MRHWLSRLRAYLTDPANFTFDESDEERRQLFLSLTRTF
jgi:hypothetical protein